MRLIRPSNLDALNINIYLDCSSLYTRSLTIESCVELPIIHLSFSKAPPFLNLTVLLLFATATIKGIANAR